MAAGQKDGVTKLAPKETEQLMVMRDSKGKRRKPIDKPKSDRETRLLSKLQNESLKVHGDPLDIAKKTPRSGRAGHQVHRGNL